jgi:cytochrome c oxidase subunit 4
MSEQASEHVVPLRVYFGVFAALLVLTWLTVAATRFDFGTASVLGVVLPLNLLVALAIAFTKATLVVLYFMHVRYGTSLVGVIVVAAVVWLGILLLLTFGDYWTRGWVGGVGS